MPAKKKSSSKKADKAITPSTDKLPAHLQGSTGQEEGFEDMSSNDILFPRIRMVQPSSDIAAEGKLAPGTVYENISDSELMTKDEALQFSVAFWFKSWVEWGDIDAGEGVIESSTNPRSELAARSRRGEKKETQKGLQPAVTEYHNFIVMLTDEPGKLYQLSCFRTGHKHGKKLLNMARMREQPLYAGRYLMCSDFKQKDAYKWYEWSFENAGWASEEEYAFLAEKHTELKELHEKSRIDFVVSDETTSDDETDF